MIGKYFHRLISLHVSAIVLLLRMVQLKVSPEMACKLQNVKQFAGQRSARFFYDPECALYYVRDAENVHYFADMMRGFKLYGAGLQKRADQLLSSYLVDHISFQKDDIIIDCGANYGDIYFGLKDQIQPQNYISFEPGKEEFKCVEKNASGGKNFNAGLSNEAGIQTFYLSSASADSSIIEPKNYTSSFEISTTTLDTLIEELSLKNIKLLKLEAEGFEPEILDGALKFLTLCEYIAIDGGKERGVKEEETFSAQTNFLLAHGFKLVGVNLAGGRALFKNAN